MVSKKKRNRIFLDALSERARLNYDPGKRIRDARKPTRKVTLHLGRKYSQFSERVPRELAEEELMIQERDFFDNWVEDYPSIEKDRTMFLPKWTQRWWWKEFDVEENNKKLKRQIEIRKVRKRKV